MQNKYLEIGNIVGTHGIKGELRVQPWCDSAEMLSEFKTLFFDKGNTPVNILNSRVHKSLVLMQIEGIDTVEKAARLRNKVLFVDRKEINLPHGSYFIQDLIGLEIIDYDNGKKYGELCDVSRTGANDVYHVKMENNKEQLIPAIPNVIKEIDITNGKILISPLKGLFDDED
jgi:16S rRNA processing protein RimM